ncbi:MAG TPA: hypothetical protein VGB19_04480 [Actinomycetota bacterium]
MRTGEAGNEALSPLSRAIIRASAVAFGALGVVLFVAPAWSAERFPWGVSDFVAMTIGGWCIGNAVLAWQAAHIWRWRSVYPSLIYLWVFGVLQAGVLVWFKDKVDLGVALAWPYVGTLALAVVAAVVGIRDLVRLRPSRGPEGIPAPRWVRGLWAFFALFVGFLAVVAALAPKGALNGRVFPEPLTPFTLRAFGAFYLSLVLGTVALTRARTMGPTTTFLSGGQGLIVPTTAAAFVYLDRFHVGVHHLQALYIAAYLGAFVASMLVLWWERRARRSNLAPSEPEVALTS